MKNSQNRLYLSIVVGLLFLQVGCSSSSSKQLPSVLPQLEQPFELHRDWQLLLSLVTGSDTVGLKIYLDKKNTYVASSEVVSAMLKSPQDTWEDQIIWQRKYADDITSGPVINEDILYIGTSKGSLYAIDKLTGRQLWQKILSSEVMSQPVVAEGKVFVRTVDGKLYALDAITGEKIWMIYHELPNLSLRGIPAVTYVDGMIFVGWEMGVVEAIVASSGKTKWIQRVLVPKGRTDLELMVDLQAKLIFKNGLLYVLGFNGKLVTLNASTGGVIWQKNISGYHNGITDSNNLYVVTNNDSVQAYDLLSGNLLWRQDNLKYRRLGDLHFFKNYIVSGDSYGRIILIDSLDGTLVGYLTHEIDTAIVQLFVQNNILYVLDENGFISRYKIVKA